MNGGSEVWQGVRRMLPIAVAGLPEGIAFGALAAGVIGHAAPIAMSVTAFSGSAQYATVSVLRDGGTLAAALLAAAALNVRYLAMSASVPGNSRRQRAAASLLLTDAAWGVAEGSRARLIGAGATDLTSWSTGTVIGVLGGSLLGDPARLGLDAAFPALFVWLLRDHLGVLALVGAVVALVLTPLLAPGLPILAAGLVAALIGVRR
jgi:predicted branched-subunit amino acid permease